MPEETAASPQDPVPQDPVPQDPVPQDPVPQDPMAQTAARGPRRNHHVAAALIGVLTAVLGFAIAVQVHAHSTSDTLSTLREDDLIGILDNQSARADRLRQQIAELQETLARLQGSGNRAQAAQQQAQQELAALQILLGTVAATGPGVVVTITDPDHKLQPEDLLDVVEELRGAGAEAIQFGPDRVSTATAFTGSPGSVQVDGLGVSAPYTVVAIGDAKTLDTALNIPGGVAGVVRAAGGDLTVSERSAVTVTAVRGLPATKYAKPAR